MPFLDQRMPTDVEKGAQGGPVFRTTVLELSSGIERRNIEWSRARAKWDLSYGMQTQVDYLRVVNFFYVMQGRANSFRFRDWVDYQLVDAPAAQITPTTYQIQKTYTAGASTYTRRITKPVTTGMVVKANNVVVTPLSINGLTGVITFSTAPALPVTVTGDFDLPVRFDVDELDLSVEHFNAASIPAIPIVVVVGE